MQTRYSEKLYLPALAIVIIVLALLVVISISTYTNLHRDREKALESVERQTLTLVHTIEAAAQAHYHDDPAGPGFLEDLLTEAGKLPDVTYICLIGPSGKALLLSDKQFQEAVQQPETVRSRNPQQKSPFRVIRQLASGESILEIRSQVTLPSSVTRFLERAGRYRLIVAVPLHPFEEARKADLQHAVIMALIVIALGAGALFFIFVIRSYYLVNRALRQAQDYTRLVIEHMANGLVSIDTHGKIVSYNRLALELLQIPENRVLGLSLDRILDFNTSGISETLTRCRTILEWEIDHSRSNGDVIPLSICATPISGPDGACRGAVIVLRDLSEIKRLESKVRRNERLAVVGQLSAVVAHEIRNPLSSIKGLAQLLAGTFSDQPEKENYARVIVSEVDRINRVVTDLLVLSKPFDARPEPVDVAELIRHAVLLVQNEAAAHGVDIRTTFGSGLESFSLDGGQMTQVLLNLLLNAVQFMPQGGRLVVGAGIEPEDRSLAIWVEDSGPGVSDEDKNRMFDPFFTTRESGTGLGLVIVHRIVENHDGDIQVISPVPGQSGGTRIQIRIPPPS